MTCMCTCTSQLPQHPADVVITAHPYLVQTNSIDARLKLTRENGLTKVTGTRAGDVNTGTLAVPLASPPSTVRNLRWIRIEGRADNAALTVFRLHFGQQHVYSYTFTGTPSTGPIGVNLADDHIRHSGRHISLEIGVTIGAGHLEKHSVSLGSYTYEGYCVVSSHAQH